MGSCSGPGGGVRGAGAAGAQPGGAPGRAGGGSGEGQGGPGGGGEVADGACPSGLAERAKKSMLHKSDPIRVMPCYCIYILIHLL